MLTGIRKFLQKKKTYIIGGAMTVFGNLAAFDVFSVNDQIPTWAWAILGQFVGPATITFRAGISGIEKLIREIKGG